MRLATWNVNSIKQRVPRLLPWLDERRARRRAIRAWLLALLVVPAAAAAGFVAVLEAAGGDLGAWSSASAAALVVGAFVGPAALSG